MAGRKPSVETIQRYEDTVEWLKGHPDTPFSGKALKQLGVAHSDKIMYCVAQMTNITNRLADGGARGSADTQRFYDELTAAHGGGLLYQTSDAMGAQVSRRYVYDTKAKLGTRGILGNQWPVVVAGKIEWAVKALEETGVGTARVVTSAVGKLELVADHGTHLVVRVGSEVVVCEVLSRGGK